MSDDNKQKQEESYDNKRLLIYGTPNERDMEDLRPMLGDHSDIHSGYPNLWMTFEMWNNPIQIGLDYKEIGLCDLLVETIDRWNEEVSKELPSFVPYWTEKFASLKFVFQGEFYQIFPGTVGSTPEHFGGFSNNMEDDLKKMGCPYTHYTGCID